MKAEKIVFATDFSPSSEFALAYATALARDMGAKLLIVHVEEPPLAYGAGEPFMPGVIPPEGDLKGTLDRVRPTDARVPFEHHILLGDPADEIVRLATEQNADMIVLGSHGRGGLTRLLMGSVAETGVRRANCPVLTIKRPLKKDET